MVKQSFMGDEKAIFEKIKGEFKKEGVLNFKSGRKGTIERDVIVFEDGSRFQIFDSKCVSDDYKLVNLGGEVIEQIVFLNEK